MDAAQWAAIAGWAAAAVSIVAAVLSGRQVKAAREQADAATDQAASSWRGANAAEESATEAREANRLAEQQLELERQRDERVQRERDERDAEQARLITYDGASNMGALSVRISNNSNYPVRALRLDAVVATDDPSWGWQPRAKASERRMIQTLDGNKAYDFQIEMIRDGEVARAVGRAYAVTFSFDDKNGIRWSRTNNDTPQRIND